MHRLFTVLIIGGPALALPALSATAAQQTGAQTDLAQFSLPWATEEKKKPPAPKTTPAPKTQPAPAPSTPTQAPPKAQPSPSAVGTPEASQEAKAPATAGPGWAVNCRSRAGEKGLSCRMSQRVVAKNSGQRLTDVAFLVGPEANTTEVLLQLPLGLYLPAGASYQVDANAPQKLSIRACTRSGCYARAPVSPETMQALRNGKQLKIDFKDRAERPVTVPLSLEGFEAAYAKIETP